MAQLGFTDQRIREVKKAKNEEYLSRYWRDISILKSDFDANEKHIIVSNTTSDVIDTILTKLEMRNHFSEIYGSDIYLGVNRKPAPDLYNYAFSQIEKMFDKENDTVVIHEDSPFGLNAAMSFYEEHKDKIKNFKIIYVPQSF
jgi:beta-phosphoglucomutase-like phosphatase (HAD superfamily)